MGIDWEIRMGYGWGLNWIFMGYNLYWDSGKYTATDLMDALAEKNGNGQESWASFEQIRALIHHYIPISITLISHEVPLFSDVIFLCSTSRQRQIWDVFGAWFWCSGSTLFFFQNSNGHGFKPMVPIILGMNINGIYQLFEGTPGSWHVLTHSQLPWSWLTFNPAGVIANSMSSSTVQQSLDPRYAWCT